MVALMSTQGCVSLSTYEHDLALARADAKAAQAAQVAQSEGLRAALQAMHRTLASEAEMRTMTVRMLEAQIQRLTDDKSRTDSGQTSGAVSSARDELQRLRLQERANAERLKQLEEALLQLASRSRPGGSPENSARRLHQYPY